MKARTCRRVRQPSVADVVADLMAKIVVPPPLNCAIELCGPEKFRLCGLVQRGAMHFHQYERPVIADPDIRYHGALIDDSS